jgi:hypothetical protein
MGIYLAGVLWVAGAAVSAAIGAAVIGYLARRFGWAEGRSDNNDLAGQVFTIVAGLHAVLIAFVLISQFDSVSVVRESTYQEADSLVAVTWATDTLGESTKDTMRQLVAAYNTTVVDQEWPRMVDGGPIPATGWSQLEQMRQAVAQVQVTDSWQTDRKTEASNQLWQVYQAREARMTAATSGGVNGVVWFALILGAVISIMLPNLFGGPAIGARIVIVSTLAGTIAMLLFAIYQLQNPFDGGARVGPDAFASALERLS